MELTVLTALDVLGYLTTAFAVLAGVWVFSVWARGIWEPLRRLGLGLARRRVALFAKGDAQASLKSLLIDSGLFQEQNIVTVSSTADIERVSKCTLFLVNWPDFSDKMPAILASKRTQVALVVYAPVDRGRIPETEMVLLNESPNAVVTNFRGRLLNDLVTSLITTSYDKH